MGSKYLEDYLKEFSTLADQWFQEVGWLEDWYNFYQDFFNVDTLKNANWSDFQQLGNHLHSFNSMAIAKGNALGRINLPIEQYRKIFIYIISNNDPIDLKINNLYKKNNSEYFLPYFGDSSISELISFAFPQQYVIYNSRSQSALKTLGIDINRQKGEQFGQFYLRYNELIQPLLKSYETIVGKRTNSTLCLELDQFFSWLYTTHRNEYKIRELIESYKLAVRTNGFENEEPVKNFV